MPAPDGHASEPPAQACARGCDSMDAMTIGRPNTASTANGDRQLGPRKPQVSGAERIQGVRTGMKCKFRSLHGSQKPLKFIDRIVRASTDRGDTVWEPFGGLCPGAVVCHATGRRYRGAETNAEFYAAAVQRLGAAPAREPLLDAA